MKKQLLMTYCSTLLIIGFQSVAMANTLNVENTSTQNNMNRMQGNSGMGMQKGQNSMGMMNGHNCMGMKNGQNGMGMMNGQNGMNMMNGQNHRGMMKGGCMNMSMQRHRFVMQNGIKSEYQNKVNPIKTMTPAILSSGKTLYDSNCATCHGKSGIGDGPAGANLTPRPANIAAFSKMPMASDAYLNWTISEGGAPISSPMPAFKSQLKEEQIWQIINYLRQL